MGLRRSGEGDNVDALARGQGLTSRIPKPDLESVIYFPFDLPDARARLRTLPSIPRTLPLQTRSSSVRLREDSFGRLRL